MAQLLAINPAKRKKSRKAKKSRRKSNPVTVSVRRAARSMRRRYRRNPIGGASNAINQFKDGAIGAAGALAVDVVMQKLPLPANLKAGVPGSLVKGFVGIGIGMAVSRFGKQRRLGQQLAQGAVTVALYNAGKNALAPALGLSGFDDQGMLGFDDQGMLGFEDLNSGMGWFSPAPVSNPYQGVDGFDDFED